MDLTTLTILGATVQTMKLLIVKPSPLPILIQKIRLRIISSNTLSLRSSLNERDQVSQTYSTTGNTIVLCILIFKLLERSREDKRVWTE
jgi:hypothetical protein